MDEMIASSNWKPSIGYRVREMLMSVRGIVRDALFRASMTLVEDGGILAHAKRELRAAGYDPNDKEDGPDKWIQENLLDLLRVMSMQGHSGFSAGYLVSAFSKLARYEPLVPLTGADDEWLDHGSGVYQNNRCGTVFKQPDRFNGQAYNIDGIIFREPDGVCYTNSASCVPIVFPYIPNSEYVDVPKSAEN